MKRIEINVTYLNWFRFETGEKQIFIAAFEKIKKNEIKLLVVSFYCHKLI